MTFLIDIIKGLLAFGAICIGLGIVYIVFIIAREVGWMIRQENRKQYIKKQNPCDFCGPAGGSYIAVFEAGQLSENRLFIRVCGGYLQMFDEEYPGFIDNIEINYCPKCGRILRE